jgi:hypothetical protein
MSERADLEINLTAVILTMQGNKPAIYAALNRTDQLPGLPSGPFDPIHHRTFEIGLRNFALAQAHLSLGYVEQLYTFGDRDRHATERQVAALDTQLHVVSIGYLALTRITENLQVPRRSPEFRDLYAFLPWEDWRAGPPALVDQEILPRLARWIAAEPKAHKKTAMPGLSRTERVALLFGNQEIGFDEEKALERYELLYEAGLLAEARRDGREASAFWEDCPILGQSMRFDHRRILATALGRIRAKIKYRPVIFEVMPAIFTLTDLQKQVEAISGRLLHKQNFRRLVETTGLVEATGGQIDTGGRPAKMFRFRRDVLTERPAPGLKVGRSG